MVFLYLDKVNFEEEKIGKQKKIMIKIAQMQKVNKNCGSRWEEA